jgi:hypothetical protein
MVLVCSSAAATGDPGALLWKARWFGEPPYADEPVADVVSPDGSTVYVAGWTYWTQDHARRYYLLAYDAATGERRWGNSYHGPSAGNDVPSAMAVSPDGATVYMTGASVGEDTGKDFATIAWDTSTREPRWIRRYDAASRADAATAVVLSPDGSAVFVTGRSVVPGGHADYATVAYDAATGTVRWVARYDGTGHGADEALAVTAVADSVVVTGSTVGHRGPGRPNLTTVAYDAATGAERWVRSLRGRGSGSAVASAPSGDAVFAVGTNGLDYVTVCYELSTGDERWLRRYDGPAGDNGSDGAIAAATSPAGDVLFVTGTSEDRGAAYYGAQYATIAYDAATGRRIWLARYGGPLGELSWAQALAVSPEGSTIFVTGYSLGSPPSGDATTRDYATVAYDADTGDELWVRRYDGPAQAADTALAIAAGPGAVYVTGYSESRRWGRDILTIAYATS